LAAELFGFILSKDRESPYTYYVIQTELGLAEMQNAGWPSRDPNR
jgi:hypothetical protein